MKKALITGGTKGIGRAIVDRLLKEGFDVAVTARNTVDLESLKIKATGDYPGQEVKVFSVDMSKSDQVKTFGADLIAEWGSIDILVNNAGFFLPGEILLEEDGTLERQIETNLYSAYYMTRAIAPAMVEQKSGHIFNMCSIASQIAYPNGGSYSISKFAMLGFSKVLREELKEKNVRVTALLPGATWSASWDGVDLPKERLMDANDIADLVWATYTISSKSVVEEIIIRPQLGDL